MEFIFLGIANKAITISRERKGSQSKLNCWSYSESSVFQGVGSLTQHIQDSLAQVREQHNSRSTLTCLGQDELLVSNSNVVPRRAVVAAEIPVGHRSHLEPEKQTKTIKTT